MNLSIYRRLRRGYKERFVFRKNDGLDVKTEQHDIADFHNEFFAIMANFAVFF